jgi:hypothetical protein
MASPAVGSFISYHSTNIKLQVCHNSVNLIRKGFTHRESHKFLCDMRKSFILTHEKERSRIEKKKEREIKCNKGIKNK